jgi:hypothetical protein
MKQQFKIEGYGLLDYSQKLQEGILLGYRLNIEDNSTAPINFGSFMHVVLEKDDEIADVMTEVTPEIEPQVEPEVSKGKPGRKAK